MWQKILYIPNMSLEVIWGMNDYWFIHFIMYTQDLNNCILPYCYNIIKIINVDGNNIPLMMPEQKPLVLIFLLYCKCYLTVGFKCGSIGTAQLFEMIKISWKWRILMTTLTHIYNNSTPVLQLVSLEGSVSTCKNEVHEVYQLIITLIINCTPGIRPSGKMSIIIHGYDR